MLVMCSRPYLWHLRPGICRKHLQLASDMFIWCSMPLVSESIESIGLPPTLQPTGAAVPMTAKVHEGLQKRRLGSSLEGAS